ncbi:hypothetical protein BIW11_03763 [Tropilaelaps mercedesae]|uniref:Uncharacterized protein n=1 Tax=Tropilaelaps mercedesae TaxID=418985 RepID=A0A1V9XG82_9ACAR|nr:hypothetical protein BIW11_03763 [Tropilaelaps mercedesae]
MLGLNKLVRGGSRLSKLFKLGGGGQEAPPVPPQPPGPEVSSPEPLSEATDCSLGSQFSLDSLDDGRNAMQVSNVPPSPETSFGKVAPERIQNPVDDSMCSSASEEIAKNISDRREGILECSPDQCSLFEVDVLPEEEIHVVQQQSTNAVNVQECTGPTVQDGTEISCPVKCTTHVSINAAAPEANKTDVSMADTKMEDGDEKPNHLVDAVCGVLINYSQGESTNALNKKGSPVRLREAVLKDTTKGKDPKQHELTEMTTARVAPSLSEDTDGKVSARKQTARTSEQPPDTAALDTAPEANASDLMTSIKYADQAAWDNDEVLLSPEDMRGSGVKGSDLSPSTVEASGDAAIATESMADEVLRTNPVETLTEKRKKNKRANRRRKSHLKGWDISRTAKEVKDAQLETKDSTVEFINQEAHVGHLLTQILQPATQQAPPQLPSSNVVCNPADDHAFTTMESPAAEIASDLKLDEAEGLLQYETKLVLAEQKERSPEDSNSTLESAVSTVESNERDQNMSAPDEILQPNAEVARSNDIQKGADAVGEKKPSTGYLDNVNKHSAADIIPTGNSVTKGADSGLIALGGGTAVDLTEDDELADAVGVPLEGLQTDSRNAASLGNNASENGLECRTESIKCCMAPFSAGDASTLDIAEAPQESARESADPEMVSDQPHAPMVMNWSSNTITREGALLASTTTKVLEEVASALEMECINLDRIPDCKLEANGDAYNTQVVETSITTCADAPVDTCVKPYDKTNDLAASETAVALMPKDEIAITKKDAAGDSEDAEYTEQQREAQPPNADMISLETPEPALAITSSMVRPHTYTAEDFVQSKNETNQSEAVEELEPVRFESGEVNQLSGEEPPTTEEAHVEPPAETAVYPSIYKMESTRDPMDEFTHFEKAVQEAERACNAKFTLDRPSKPLREKSSSPLPARKTIGKPKRMDQAYSRENSLGKIERPSKLLREHSMSPIHFRKARTRTDSLDTTADSISLENSIAQDVTYDIVDDERVRPSKSKKFTFGLEVPTCEPPAMVSSTIDKNPVDPSMALGASYIVEKNVSEESLPLASELENVEDRPEKPSVHLSPARNCQTPLNGPIGARGDVNSVRVLCELHGVGTHELCLPCR